ncbi:DGQHR domain-containing protein [Microbacterium sp. CFH 31415]|uniref:DGQHR domain-containing protein n=1 Tax=Microbacterium sp. CFH 31415 TaxID=2921732 RepID=UPI001F139329|nr:DGQHR domain-containing protein [Microbacterium sp. CFH 31415]MCH6230169.1 DGQHR domain-containing protein [Microbacterium sp. CFH 31415]
MKVSPALQKQYEDEGWIVDKTLKTSVWMRRIKRHDVQFEDLVWAMCARLGFETLNRDRSMKIPYGKGSNESKQIDILAADDEVVLVIECKSSGAEYPPTQAFKTETESIKGYRAGVIASIRSHFPKHKIRFILAINNIHASKDTLDRVQNADISILDEEAVSYYHELANHLGTAAKFQLLGNLFHGQQIAAIEAEVPAIKGRMGGFTYYSFAIEPARLLKISYVLHRNSANVRWMPTYQRIIKRSRLKKVSQFVDSGGFFPNSLIVNIDNGGKPLKFDRSGKHAGSTTLGVLHLPRKYRSAYIIDGQHRLYGFAHSDRAATELIPVVAFVDLPSEKQLELFMQINENQQAVPKNLQNTLNADLLWSSPDKRKQAHALKLKIAQLLGEVKSSPLRGRIIIGEEQSDTTRCVSLDAVQRGIDRGRFIGEFTANAVKSFGSFYRTSNDDTCSPLVEFLELCFGYLRDQLPTQWNIGRGEGGFVFTNAGVEALIRVIGDVVDHLDAAGLIDPRENSPSSTFTQTRPMLKTLAEHLGSLPLDEVSEFRGWLGGGAPTKYLRRFQSAIADSHAEFQPDGLAEWIADQEKQFNVESFTMVHAIEAHLNSDIRRRLEDRFGTEWVKNGVPKKVYQDAQAQAAAKQYDAAPGTTIDWWDCLYLINYREILQHGNMALWNEIYDADYTLPSDEKKTSWKDKSGWLVRLNDIRNKVSHNGTVTEDEYDFLHVLNSHFGL